MASDKDFILRSDAVAALKVVCETFLFGANQADYGSPHGPTWPVVKEQISALRDCLAQSLRDLPAVTAPDQAPGAMREKPMLPVLALAQYLEERLRQPLEEAHWCSDAITDLAATMAAEVIALLPPVASGADGSQDIVSCPTDGTEVELFVQGEWQVGKFSGGRWVGRGGPIPRQDSEAAGGAHGIMYIYGPWPDGVYPTRWRAALTASPSLGGKLEGQCAWPGCKNDALVHLSHCDEHHGNITDD